MSSGAGGSRSGRGRGRRKILTAGPVCGWRALQGHACCARQEFCVVRVHCAVVIEQWSMQAERRGSIVKNCDRHSETHVSCASSHAAAAMHAPQTVCGCAAATNDQRHPLKARMRNAAFTFHSIRGVPCGGPMTLPCRSLLPGSLLLVRYIPVPGRRSARVLRTLLLYDSTQGSTALHCG